MSIDLTQAEADTLIAMKKRVGVSSVFIFPSAGGKLEIPLESVDGTEDFLLDVYRSRIDLSKITYQNRARVVIVLLRLDVNGAPHRNPDGALIPCPHLHLYREGFGDKWAVPVGAGQFQHLDNQVQTLLDFMAECNVIESPTIQSGLF